MELELTGEVVEWRGPAPYVFVRTPDDVAEEIRAVAPAVSYGWGVIPVEVRIGGTRWTTSLIPREGTYLVPVRKVVQEAESIAVGTVVTARLRLEV